MARSRSVRLSAGRWVFSAVLPFALLVALASMLLSPNAALADHPCPGRVTDQLTADSCRVNHLMLELATLALRDLCGNRARIERNQEEGYALLARIERTVRQRGGVMPDYLSLIRRQIDEAKRQMERECGFAGILSNPVTWGVLAGGAAIAAGLGAAAWQHARASAATSQPPAQRPEPLPRRQFDAPSGPIGSSPSRPKAPRGKPRRPILGPKARQRPGVAVRGSSEPGPRYEEPPPPQHALPPPPIGPGGEPIGGVGITNPLPPRPSVRDPRVWINGGIVQMTWNPPLYDTSKERLVGYEISRQQPMPDTTGYPRLTLDVLPPDAVAWQGQHLEGSRFYHVAPLYEDVITHRIVYGTTPVWYR